MERLDSSLISYCSLFYFRIYVETVKDTTAMTAFQENLNLFQERIADTASPVEPFNPQLHTEIT